MNEGGTKGMEAKKNGAAMPTLAGALSTCLSPKSMRPRKTDEEPEHPYPEEDSRIQTRTSVLKSFF